MKKKMMRRIVPIVIIIGIVLLIAVKTSSTDDVGTIIVYPDSNAEDWLYDTEKSLLSIEETVSHIIKGNYGGIPASTKLLGYYLEDTVLYLDFNRDFEEMANGDLIISLNLEMIAHTMCINERFNVDEVIYLLEGERPMFIGPNDNLMSYTSDLKRE